MPIYHSFSSLHQTLPQFRFSSSLHLNGSLTKCATRRFVVDCATKKPNTLNQLSLFGKIVIGGTSAVTLAFRCNRFVVSCHANRLAGEYFVLHFIYNQFDIDFYVRLSDERHKKWIDRFWLAQVLEIFETISA